MLPAAASNAELPEICRRYCVDLDVARWDHARESHSAVHASRGRQAAERRPRMTAMEAERTDAEKPEDFDLDLQITVVPFDTPGNPLRMDGWTTYTTCHASCECPP